MKRFATESSDGFEESLRQVELLFPYSEGGTLAELHELAGDLEREDRPDGVLVKARIPAALAHRFADFALNGAGVAAGPGRNRLRPALRSRGGPPGQASSDDARLPSRAHDGDAGLDLHAAEARDARAGRAGQRRHRDRGRDPPGHAGLVLPRSGLAARDGIALVNSPGLIDSGYRGEIRVLLLNTDRERRFDDRAGRSDRAARC